MVVIAAIPAVASDTRVTTLGEVNNVIKDNANIWLYPHTIQYYPRLVTAEYMSGSDFSSIGVHLPLDGEKTPKTLGFYFYENSLIIFGIPGVTRQPNLPNHRMTVFYGTQLSEIPLGFALDYIQASYRSEEENDETELSNFQLAFRLSCNVTDKLELASALAFWNYTDKDQDGNESTETSGNLLYHINGRYWMDPRGEFRPVLHAGLANRTETINLAEISHITLESGIGFNYNRNENVLVVTDFGLMYEREKISVRPVDSEVSHHLVVLPYFRAGIDAKAFRWMDIRAGVASYWNRMKTKYPTALSLNFVYTNTYLGAGFHWGNLRIDAQLQPQFLRNGPYFISGEDTNGGLASRITAEYWFD